MLRIMSSNIVQIRQVVRYYFEHNHQMKFMRANFLNIILTTTVCTSRISKQIRKNTCCLIFPSIFRTFILALSVSKKLNIQRVNVHLKRFMLHQNNHTLMNSLVIILMRMCSINNVHCAWDLNTTKRIFSCPFVHTSKCKSYDMMIICVCI